MHFDLINFFHLVSVISFYKKHMAAWLYLDKEQFLCSIKKKFRELVSVSRDNGSAVEGDGWSVYTMLVSGLLSRAECGSQPCSPLTAVTRWVLSGGLSTLSPRGLHRHAHLKAKCLLDRGQAATACNGKEERHLFSAVSAKGIQKWSFQLFQRVFLMRSLKVMGPPPNQSLESWLCGLYFHQYYFCNKCLLYIH